MVRIELHPRLLKTVGRLSDVEKRSVESALVQLRGGFGNPHQHSGLGIRRLKKDFFECRAGLDLRILFLADRGVLTAYDVMTHSEIQKFLRYF
jgi:hypothetical protein